MIRCISFRPYSKNTLKGFADLHLVSTGLVLRDCCWHESHGKEWISLPARSYQTKDGSTSWSPIVEFADGATKAREQFQKLAVEAIHRFVGGPSA